MTEWAHRVVLVRPYRDRAYGTGYQIRVTAGLHHLQGNARPYFSVTADIYKPGARDIEAGGCLHREVLRSWPKLAPVVALHLCDDTGAPMHAEVNGWYQLAGYYGGAGERYHGGNADRQHWNDDGSFNGYRHSTPDECLQVFAESMRIPVETARALADGWRDTIQTKLQTGERQHGETIRALFRAWVETQRERWQAEAEAAIALLDTLAASQTEAQ